MGHSYGVGSWAIVCGWYINAYSIVTALRTIGWQGRIVCLKDRHDGPVFMELVRPRVRVMETDFDEPDKLIDFIAKRFPAEDPKYIFFTDEVYHPAFRDEALRPRLKNTFFHVGSISRLDEILDRYAFYHRVEAQDGGPIPRTIVGTEDPWQAFPEGFFIRPRLTWKGKQKLERVKRVMKNEELAQITCRWRAQGLDESDWCYQEVLSIRPQDNVSISGWHAPGHRIYVATRHILRHPNDVGNGDVAELVSLPEGLQERAERILDGLEYSGPFELEFILDTRDGFYKPIELNPRFWMQHGLIEAITNNELVRRYVGIEPTGVAREHADNIRYWVNGFYALFRILRGDGRVLPFLRSREAIRVPTFPLSFRWLLRYPHHKRVARPRPQ